MALNKVGVSDIVIPFPTVSHHGLYLELKRDKHAVVTKGQENWRTLMRRLDYRAEIAIGFDAATLEYRDLLKAGVVDPTKVTRSALQNAASIAKNILTTEAVVAEPPEKAPAGAGAGMPDMGGMM